MQAPHLVGHHDPVLVVLSIAIAVFASYSALDLAGRMRAASGPARRLWLVASAVTLGGGIWSMHFVAMLAFSLDRPIAYGMLTTAASLAAAILVTGIGLHLVARRPAHGSNLVVAGTFTGMGIATMHYTGMAAMQMNATTSYEPWLFALSIVIAIVASIVALWLAFNLDRVWEKIAAGFVMGGAIAGMHYTAMHAAIFSPLPEATEPMASGSTIPLQAAIVAIATLCILFLGLMSASLDRLVAAQRDQEMTRLRRERSRFRTILDTAQEAFIIINADGRITFWNRQAEQTFGWFRAQVIGRRLDETIIPERFRAGHIKGLQRFLATGESTVLNQRLELYALRANGQEFPIELTISAVQRDGKVTFNAFVHDISERKRYEQELIAAKEQAEAANDAKTMFLANMSHELRTPLNAIIGFSEIIQNQARGPVANPLYREYATDISRSGHHLLGLINDILDASRAETGQLLLREHPFNIVVAIEAALSTVREVARDARVELLLELTPNLPWLHADAQRIEQVLTNLLSNAVKFTEPGGRVTLAAAMLGDGTLQFTVSDTGIGMTAEQIQIALAPFGQVDARLSRRYEGAGIGLPLTKRLLDLHQASLAIDSTPGAGTRVDVRFPAARVRTRLASAGD